MDSDDEVEPPERKFLTSRYKVKTGDDLLAAVADNVALIGETEKEVYDATPERENIVTYEIVVKKGELYNMDPESTTNPVQFNKQVTDEDLKELRCKCSGREFVEVVRFLPEFNFSKDECFKHVKSRTKPQILFECGVQGCLRQQQRWQERMLHGSYPQEDITFFQHDKTNTKPSCYFVNKKENTLKSDKYLDVLSDFEDVEHHRTGKERKRTFKKKRVVAAPPKRSSSK